MYAVGIGPLLTDLGRLYTQFACEQAQLITVRDVESKQKLESLGFQSDDIQVTADPAFGVQPAKISRSLEKKIKSDGPVICAAIRNWDLNTSPSYWEKQVAGALDIFIDNHHGKVIFLPFQDLENSDLCDREVSDRVKFLMHNKDRAIVFDNVNAVAQKAGIISLCDLVLGMRLHSVVYAIGSGVPVVGLVYDKKVRNLMNYAKINEYALGIEEITAQSLSNLLTRALQDKDELNKILPIEGGTLKSLARINAQLTLNILKHPSSEIQPKKPITNELLRSIALSHSYLIHNQQSELKVHHHTIVELQSDLEKQISKHTANISNLQYDLENQIGDRNQSIQELKLELNTQAKNYDELVSSLEDKLNRQIDKRDAAIDELRGSLRTKVGERDEEISDLKRKLAEQDEHFRERCAEYETQLRKGDRAIDDLKIKHEELSNAHEHDICEIQAARSRLESQNTKLHFELFGIQTSRYWKVLSIYWGFRGDISNRYDRFRAWLRKLIPFNTRQSMVRVLRKVNLYPQHQDLPYIPHTGEKINDHGLPDAVSPEEKKILSYDIICFPIIDWGFRFQRPQQLITQFTNEGHRCFYVKTTFHQNGLDITQEAILENVINIQLPGPLELNIYRDELTPKIVKKMMAALENLFYEANLVAPIYLVQLPFWTPLALELKTRWGGKLIYDCMDEHTGFSTNSEKMLQQEDRIIINSDLVLATSHILYQKCSQITNQVILLPNAVDFNHFTQSSNVSSISNLDGPIIGYIGAISDWFDSEMIASAASKRPDWQFVLIGDTYGADLVPLQGLENVHLLGEKPYNDLPGYLHQFDVACIPFRRTPLTLATNPVKFYEYMSTGKPIVSLDLPELEPFKDYYYPIHSANQFISEIEAALNESSQEIVTERIRIAQSNTWNHRYKKLGGAIQQLFGNATIVIANHNNLEYISKCLNSIFAKTVYPKFKVIVVDNGSDADVVELLRTMEAVESRLQVIFSKEILGFASANNIGITAAGDCEYLVLLNSDTVVTTRWLSTLIRYLDDTTVTLVGPVTNSIGNEARIEVDYEELDDMNQFAHRYCRENAGICFDIPMLAMYCLAMRKSVQTKIGLLDERFGLGMFEDDDYTVRARKLGGRIICAEDVFIHHWGGSFYGRLGSPEFDQLFDENRRKFEEKWGQKWQPHKYRNQKI